MQTDFEIESMLNWLYWIVPHELPPSLKCRIATLRT